MSSRARIRVFAGVVAATLALFAAYLGYAAARGTSNDAGASRASLARIAAAPYVVYLTSRSGDAPYDRLAVAPLADPRQDALVGLRCDRVAMVETAGVCVRHSATVGLAYTVTFFDRRFAVESHARGQGIPSRARVSPSGRLAAVTSFVQGDSYLASGQFSTTTSIFRVRDGAAVVRSLEQLRVLKAGTRFEPVNRNFWGVTFANDDRFYATMGTGTHTYLVRGSLARRTLTVVHENVECPALSPDGTRIGFKRRLANGDWHFTVLDLRSGRETPLAEPTPIDDQLAWSDAGHVLFGFEGKVWSLPADGGGSPRVLLEAADSPTVVRPQSYDG